MLTFIFPPSFAGGTRQAFELAKGLRQQGVNSIFLGANLRQALPHEQLEGFPVYRFATAQGARLQYLVYALRVCRFLLQQRQSYELVLLHSTRPFNFLVLALLKLLGKRALLSLTLIGNDDPRSLRQKSFLWKIEGRMLKYFDRVVCKSSALHQICVTEKIPTAKLAAIPNGADLQKFRPARARHEKEALRREFDLPPEAFVLAFTGRLSTRKGSDLLLDAWEQVRPLVPDGLLLLLGPYQGNASSGTETEHFREQLRCALAEQHARCLRFTGELDHARLALYLRSSDAFVFPSQREGLPNSVIEAMASGLPVICSEIPGVTTDLVKHGVTGLILKSREASDLAGLILQFYRNRRRCIRLGAQAAKTAQNRFSIEVVARQHATLYRELLKWN